VTSTISVTNVNDPPNLSGLVGTPVAFGRQTVPLLFSSFLQVSDPDNLALVGASVAVTGGTASAASASPPAGGALHLSAPDLLAGTLAEPTVPHGSGGLLPLTGRT